MITTLSYIQIIYIFHLNSQLMTWQLVCIIDLWTIWVAYNSMHLLCESAVEEKLSPYYLQRVILFFSSKITLTVYQCWNYKTKHAATNIYNNSALAPTLPMVYRLTCNFGNIRKILIWSDKIWYFLIYQIRWQVQIRIRYQIRKLKTISDLTIWNWVRSDLLTPLL